MQQQIQAYIENTSTNPRFGSDPSQIDFPVFGRSCVNSENENFIITSRYTHANDHANLYYHLMFRDVSLKELSIQLTPICSIKKGFLKVSPAGEMTILNEDLKTYYQEPRPIVSNDIIMSTLVYFGLLYRLEKFTDAKFTFANGQVVFTDGFTAQNFPEPNEDQSTPGSKCKI